MSRDQIFTTAIALTLSVALLIFGIYLLYDGAIIALMTGVIEERGDVIVRAERPLAFWLATVMDGLIDLMVVAGGVFACWLALPRRRDR